MCEYIRPAVALEWPAQSLLLLYRYDHVDGNFIIGRNTEHDDSKKLPVMHGYVENMELSDITQVTGDH